MTAAALPTAVPMFEGATPLPAHPRRAFVAQIMGLPVSVHVRGPHAGSERITEAVRRFFEALRDDDARFSTWKPDSEASRIRRGELRWGDASLRMQRVARLCAEATVRTGGAFDAWLPPRNADGPRGFDPTGLVKGWAVEQAFDALAAELEHGDPHDVLVNAGGDVAVHCARTDTPDWLIAIEDPRDRTLTLATVPLRRGAVATSGTAARGAHIVDPRTGLPARDLVSATVIGPSLTWADVYATAAVALGRDAPAWIGTWPQALPGHLALLVHPDGRTTLSRPA